MSTEDNYYNVPEWLLQKSRDHLIKYGFAPYRRKDYDDEMPDAVAPQTNEQSHEDPAQVGNGQDVNNAASRLSGGLVTAQASLSPQWTSVNRGTSQQSEQSVSTGASLSRKGQIKDSKKSDSIGPGTPIPDSLFLSAYENNPEYPVPKSLPEWYTDIKDSSYRMTQFMRKKPQALASLESLKACIRQCDAQPSIRMFDKLRDHVHKAEITLVICDLTLRKARILHPEVGLPRIFGNTDFPWDLRADAFQLYRRWCDGNFNVDLLRGIIKGKALDRTGDRIDKEYKAKYCPSAKYYGEGHLVPGQWWPTQLCTVRDGAHGSTQGGIFGEKDRGAYSIVLSGGNNYHNEDEGDFIEYSGTVGKDSQPSEATQRLIESCDTIQQPVRVIRSHQLSMGNPFRPESGLRYDGLYEVKSYKITDQETAMHRFHLQRCKNQKPIRYENNAARRPTQFEVAAYWKLRM